MEYQEIINVLENKRKNLVKNILISAGIVLLSIIIGYIIDKEVAPVYAGFAGLIVSIILVSNKYSSYKKMFKDNFMPLIISKTGLDLKYDYKDGIGENTVNHSRLFKKADRFFHEDLMYGTLDGVEFMSSDVHMQDRRVTTDSKGRRRVKYVTFFKGRWFVYEFNKQFNGIIQVREDNIFSSLPWGLKLEKIKLEDIEFNKKFNTYATNQHDAFYVLTPTIMENIKKLERRFPGRIFFSFIENQLHIAINHQKDSFEPPIFSPIDESFINEIVVDILIIQDIVNELRLNRNIFK